MTTSSRLSTVDAIDVSTLHVARRSANLAELGCICRIMIRSSYIGLNVCLHPERNFVRCFVTCGNRLCSCESTAMIISESSVSTSHARLPLAIDQRSLNVCTRKIKAQVDINAQN